jgi:hypothetical protein
MVIRANSRVEQYRYLEPPLKHVCGVNLDRLLIQRSDLPTGGAAMQSSIQFNSDKK